MPALAERTKIRTGNTHIPTTSGLVLHGSGFPESYILGGHPNESVIETNVYLITASSTKMQAVQYFPELSPKAKDLLRRIYKFKELSENWDDNGAVPPSDQIINNAAFFLTTADEFDLPIYFAAPGPNGEIVLEYKSGSKTAEVYFEEKDFSEMILYNGNEQAYVGESSLIRLIQHLGLTEVVYGE